MRPLSVRRYVRSLQKGLWEMTCDPYVLSPEGRLLNGQHRTEAVLRAAIPPEEIIIGATKDPNAYLGMDLGTARRLQDFYKNRTGKTAPTSVLSGIVSEALDFQYGIRESARIADEILSEYDLLEESAMLPRRMLVGQFAAALRACRLDRTLAVPFFTAAFEGSQALREGGQQVTQLKLLQHAWARSAKDTKQGDESKQAMAYYGLQAFRAYYEGKTLTKLQAPKGGWGAHVEIPISLDYIAAEKKSGHRRRRAKLT